jgi:RNA polymerase sigma-70 factor (ECF subfamily)
MEPFPQLKRRHFERLQASNPEDQGIMPPRLENLSDAELLELSIGGEESAFLSLYERLKGPIFRYALYMTMSKTAAEEVTQEVFIALLKDGNRYKPAEGDLPGFAFGIAHNLIRRLNRRERLYEELPGDEVLDKLSGRLLGTEELSVQVMRNQDVEKIRAAIASLPDHYRQVIVLCDLCELTYAEAASRLQCAVGTVRSRRNRARGLLAQKLKQTKKPQPELPAAGTEECLT